MTFAVASSTDPVDLRAAARDLWPRDTLAMWQGKPTPLPARVLWPETDAGVLDVLRTAAAASVPVVVYGAGSGVCGGATHPDGGAWVLDTKRFDAIGDVDPATWIVEAGAGVNGQQLEDALNRQGYTLGHSPSSIGCSTVGGWAAARSAGQFSSRYGVFEDMVVGLDGVSAAGPFRCGFGGDPARPTWPEPMLDHLLGSEGSLAVITRVRMRVRPLPEARWLRGYRFPDVASTVDAMRLLMQHELWPSAVRLYDPIDTLIGGKTRPKKEHAGPAWWRRWLDAVDALPGVRKNSVALPLRLPSVLQHLAEGLSHGCLLIVGWEGSAPVVDALATAGHALLAARSEDLGPGPGERWYASRHAVSYKLMPVFERGGFADTMEVAARWSELPGLYEAVRRAVGPHVLVMAHMSHVYPEGGCIYFSFAGRGDARVYASTWDAAQDAVLAHGGTVTHHHGVGRLKAAWAARERGAAARFFLADRGAHAGPLAVPAPTAVVDAATPVPPPTLHPDDGLARVALDGRVIDAVRPGEPRWGWTELRLPRAAREPWQTTWLEVRGTIDGHPVALGRGPRSAAGPDLRRDVADADPAATATIAWADADLPRACGRAVVDDPWAAARRVLRADLRPAVLQVEDGSLYVGFRGEACGALLGLARQVVPGLEPCAWRAPVRIGGDLVPCADDDPAVVAVTCESAWRPATPATVHTAPSIPSPSAEEPVVAPPPDPTPADDRPPRPPRKRRPRAP